MIVEREPWEMDAARAHENHHLKQEEVRPLILLAEDDDEFRAVLGGELQRAGLRVALVSDGDALVDELRSGAVRGELPDLVITDNRMPGYSGMEVIESLHEAGCVTPVILITGFGDDETIRTARAHGAAAVFSKPFDLRDLRRAIMIVLDGGGVGAEVEEQERDPCRNTHTTH